MVDMKSLLKPFASLLALLAIVSACSPKRPADPAKTQVTVPAGKPRFTIIPTDVAGMAEITTVRPPGTNAAYVINLQFTDAKAEQFRDFTREHAHQQVQLLVGGRIVAEPVIGAEISNGQADLTFASPEAAQAVANSLAKSLHAVSGAGKTGNQTNR